MDFVLHEADGVEEVTGFTPEGVVLEVCIDSALYEADEGDEAVEFVPEDVVLEVCEVDSGTPEGMREGVFSRG